MLDGLPESIHCQVNHPKPQRRRLGPCSMLACCPRISFASALLAEQRLYCTQQLWSIILIFVAVVPGPGGACGDKCKHTGLLSLLVGRFQKKNLYYKSKIACYPPVNRIQSPFSFTARYQRVTKIRRLPPYPW